jgi:hypothetical protein
VVWEVKNQDVSPKGSIDSVEPFCFSVRHSRADHFILLRYTNMKITITTKHVLILLGAMLLAFMACLPIALVAAYPANRSDAPATQAAATVQAVLTQSAVAQPTAIPTQTPLPPTAVPPTSIPATNTPIPTVTPVSYCDWVEFVKDVTVPDGSSFAPGETFTKIWRLKNRGTCAWTPDYKLVFTSGAQMSGPTIVSLPVTWPPARSWMWL